MRAVQVAAAGADFELVQRDVPEPGAGQVRAGVTTFNALRHSGARAGDLVGVLGVGGLGHLGVQFAASMGYRTVAIARGKDKEPLARKLGARHYIDSGEQDVAVELDKLGGTSRDCEDATAFSAQAGVVPMIETMPLERAAEAYERMMSGAARFRMVLTTGS